jgi:polar amino acid transport system substrate-binding protein
LNSRHPQDFQEVLQQEDRMYKKVLVIVLLMLFTGIRAWVGGEEEPRISEMIHIMIATDATFPPMEFVDDSGEIVGFDVDLMKVAAEAGGFTIEFKQVPWDSIFTGLASGRFDAVMSSVTITDERERTMDFSIPYLIMEQVLVVNREDSDARGLKDLSGQIVAALDGSVSASELVRLKDRFQFVVKTYHDSVPHIVDLAGGRLGAILIDAVQVCLVENDPQYAGKLHIVGEPIAEERYGVAVGKGNHKVLISVNSGLKSVLNTETYEQIVDKWF